MYDAQADGRRGAAADRALVPSLSRGARRGDRRAARRVRRRVARQLPFDAGGRRRERRRSGARARRFRAGRSRRHDLCAGVHGIGRRDDRRPRLLGGDQRPVQGRRARAEARAAGGSAGTACRSRSTAASTWTSRRSSPTRTTPTSRPTSSGSLAALRCLRPGADLTRSAARRPDGPLDPFRGRCQTSAATPDGLLPVTVRPTRPHAASRRNHETNLARTRARRRRRRCCSAPRSRRPPIPSVRSR